MTLSWLLTYALHSTALIGAVWLVARRFPDEHAWLDVAWKTALFGPIVTATIQVAGGLAPLGWHLPRETARANAAVAVERHQPSREVGPPRTQVSGVEPVMPAGPAETQSSQRRTPSVPATAGVQTAMTLDWPQIMTLAWAGVAATLLATFVVRVTGVHRALRRGAQEPPAALADVAEALSSANGTSRIRLAVSPACAVPLAMTGRWVVLPERMLGELAPSEQRAALAHEIAHVVRCDPAWRLAAGVLERLAFFQPLNRLARRRMCETAEFLCDQWAVRRTGPLALARSLATVASWTPLSAGRTLAGASAMAETGSPLVRRVTSILDQRQHRAARHAPLLVAAGLLTMSVVAPGVLAAPVDGPEAAPPPAPLPAGAQNRRVQRAPSQTDPLQQRWQWALDEASRQRLRDFWIAYSFVTPTHAGDLMVGDTRDGTIVSRRGKLVTEGPSLASQLGDIPSARGTLVSMFHHTAPENAAIDRAGYRSPDLGFSFGSAAVFWLGPATEADSFSTITKLFEQVRFEEGQTLMIELASLHPTTDRVLPFLTGLLEHSRPEKIRQEAAEGFDHHHDPRSVAILMRVARADPSLEVRVEAAETIGEVQTPESIPALTELATTSPDERVRAEAAEAFGDQPADAALPALERLIETSVHDEVLAEALEALAGFKDSRVLPLLVRTATSHKSQRAKQEAVETMGEVEDPGAVAALVDIIWKHTDVEIQREAVETLGDRTPVPKDELRRVRRDHPREEVREEAQETLDDHR